MRRILFLIACAGLVVAVEKTAPAQSGMMSISSEVKDGRTLITAKIPYGQALQITCPQNPGNKKTPLQTVQIVGAKYQVPRGAKDDCHSTYATSFKEVQVCNTLTSATCTITSTDPSKQKGCEKRRLGIKYVCGDAVAPPPPPPPGVVMLMVNNMIDDFD